MTREELARIKKDIDSDDAFVVRSVLDTYTVRKLLKHIAALEAGAAELRGALEMVIAGYCGIGDFEGTGKAIFELLPILTKALSSDIGKAGKAGVERIKELEEENTGLINMIKCALELTNIQERRRTLEQALARTENEAGLGGGDG